MNADLHTLAGAYVLDALSAEERSEFRRHLEGCPACTQEVRELRETAAELGTSAAQEPPARLKSRVMAALDTQPQLPPRPLSAPHQPATRRWRRWVAGVAAAAAVAVAVGIGISQWPQPEAPEAAVEKVFEAPDAQSTTVQTEAGATLTVAASRSLDKMALDSDQLPALGDRQVYQLWTLHGGTATSAGLITDPDDGVAMDLPGKGVKIAITVEPHGGSSQPTSKPILVLTPSNL